MNYEFPKIRHLDDVLPHVEDRAEFKVNYKDGYTVVNYMVSFADTFNMTGPDDVGGAIRRECRGLIFHRDGRIMSRPFHKFFNIGEREETQPHVLDFSASHTLMDKADGCLDENTLLLCADGKYNTISHIIANKLDVMGLDENNSVVKSNYIDGLVSESRKEWVEIITDDGVIHCTADHRFLTDDGYVEAKDLLGKNLEEFI